MHFFHTLAYRHVVWLVAIIIACAGEPGAQTAAQAPASEPALDVGTAATGGQYDGTWQGHYVITENHGDFECQGGNIETTILDGAVVIELSNERSQWVLNGRIDGDGQLIAEGAIGDYRTVWRAEATQRTLAGHFDVPDLCAGDWSAERG